MFNILYRGMGLLQSMVFEHQSSWNDAMIMMGYIRLHDLNYRQSLLSNLDNVGTSSIYSDTWSLS